MKLSNFLAGLSPVQTYPTDAAAQAYKWSDLTTATTLCPDNYYCHLSYGLGEYKCRKEINYRLWFAFLGLAIFTLGGIIALSIWYYKTHDGTQKPEVKNEGAGEFNQLP